MSPLPHFFGLDFTGAGPWIILGLVAGLFLGWIWRALRGSQADAKAQQKIAEIEALLDTTRSEHQAEVARLLSDTRNYEQALADAERRAAANAQRVAELTSGYERMSSAEVALRNELLSADQQLTQLKGSVQWAESQARGSSQDRQALEQQIIALRSERQTFAVELATAKTAAELKDAEISRLINQVQWFENRSRAMEQERLSFASNASAASAKDAEIARLSSSLAGARTEADRLAVELASAQAENARVRGELGNVRASMANAQTTPAATPGELEAVRTKYETAWKDLTYMRNLAYWQASEVDRLRKAITQFEIQTAESATAFADLNRRHSELNAKLAKNPSGSAISLISRRASGANASGPVRQRPAGAARAALMPKAKAYKLGKAVIAAGPAGAAKQRINGMARNINANAPGRRIGFSELQALREKVAQLSEDAALYRRLRQALDTANRIAGQQA